MLRNKVVTYLVAIASLKQCYSFNYIGFSDRFNISYWLTIDRDPFPPVPYTINTTKIYLYLKHLIYIQVHYRSLILIKLKSHKSTRNICFNPFNFTSTNLAHLPSSNTYVL